MYMCMYVCIYLFFYLSIYLFIHLSIYLSSYLSLSIYLSISLSACLSTYLQACKHSNSAKLPQIFELDNFKKRDRVQSWCPRTNVFCVFSTPPV